MLKSIDYEIQSCDDAELNIKRNSKLNFKLFFDDSKEIEALLFIIPGLGDDMAVAYRENLAKFVSENFNVAVCGVDYFCVANRPQVGSTEYFDDIDMLILKATCESVGVKLNDKIKELSTTETFDYINTELKRLKNEGKIELNTRLIFSSSVKPKKDEYNNFGIMSAIDIINALLFVRKNPPFKLAPHLNGGGGFAFYNARFFSRRISSAS